jgi:hypothetical protein
MTKKKVRQPAQGKQLPGKDTDTGLIKKAFTDAALFKKPLVQVDKFNNKGDTIT